ncbi:beta-1,3-galactosyltransferase 5-like [Lineus longissimus]|uniref:beta-1,3-galactosyltransferase 5-like n=1 Tax=Lineus longissimus TaxID=88925 RepID=UPI00315C8CD6
MGLDHLKLMRGVYTILVFYMVFFIVTVHYVDERFSGETRRETFGEQKRIPRKIRQSTYEPFVSVTPREHTTGKSLERPNPRARWQIKPMRETLNVKRMAAYPDFRNFTRFAIINNYDIVRKINNERLCSPDNDSRDGILVLVLILSTAGNFERRRNVRLTYSRIGGQVRHLFLLGKPNTTELQKRIVKESVESLDIVQFNFTDNYRDLVKKTIGGLQWAVRFCRNTKYVLKTDDDVMVFSERLVRFLRQVKEEFLYSGRVVSGPAYRDNTSKWFVSEEDYPFSSYPQYAEGYGVLMSFPVVEKFTDAARRVPFIPVEDAYIGLLARATGIIPRCNTALARGNLNLGSYVHCSYRNLMVLEIKRVTGEKYLETWRKYAQNNDSSCINTTVPIAFVRKCNTFGHPLNISLEIKDQKR